VAAAQIGSRSGLIAIAPTTSVVLAYITPNAAITPAAAMKSM